MSATEIEREVLCRLCGRTVHKWSRANHLLAVHPEHTTWNYDEFVAIATPPTGSHEEG